MTTTISISEMGVAEIADLVGAGEVTPTEVLEAVFERIDATEDKIQAWSQLKREVAMAEAAELTAEAKSGKLRGPLHGVPVAVKEEFWVKDMPTLFRGPDAWLEKEDSSVVRKLREAGAIIVGKTHMPIAGVNPPTRNPWGLGHTAGGSSSGSGAAVGARVVPMAVGEQTGGSCLRPAAYCGVEAIKPTYGRIARFGCYPFTWSRDTAGLIGLTMADLALVMSAVSGYDPKDPTSLHDAPPPADLDMASYTTPKIGVVRNFFPEKTLPEMNDAIDKSAAILAAKGAKVVDIMLPPEYSLAWTAGAMSSAESAAMNAERRAGDEITLENIRGRVAELLPAPYFVQARRARSYLQEIMTRQLKEAGLDAWLMAVAPGAAPMGLESTGDASLLSPWTWLGFPGVTVNGGLDSEGMPLGLQFCGAPKEDWEMMRLGAWCEEALGRLPAPTF